MIAYTALTLDCLPDDIIRTIIRVDRPSSIVALRSISPKWNLLVLEFLKWSDKRKPVISHLTFRDFTENLSDAKASITVMSPFQQYFGVAAAKCDNNSGVRAYSTVWPLLKTIYGLVGDSFELDGRIGKAIWRSSGLNRLVLHWAGAGEIEPALLIAICNCLLNVPERVPQKMHYNYLTLLDLIRTHEVKELFTGFYYAEAKILQSFITNAMQCLRYLKIYETKYFYSSAYAKTYFGISKEAWEQFFGKLSASGKFSVEFLTDKDDDLYFCHSQITIRAVSNP